MLQVNLNDLPLDKDGEKHVRKMHRKLERELGSQSPAQIVFAATTKSRKQSQVYMSLSDETGPIYEQEFSTKCWKSALDLCVQHAVWVFKKKSPTQQMAAASSRYATY